MKLTSYKTKEDVLANTSNGQDVLVKYKSGGYEVIIARIDCFAHCEEGAIYGFEHHDLVETYWPLP